VHETDKFVGHLGDEDEMAVVAWAAQIVEFPVICPLWPVLMVRGRPYGY
jgi:hypothetical protein